MANIFRQILGSPCAKSYPSKLSCKLYSEKSKEKPRYAKLFKVKEMIFPKSNKKYKNFYNGLISFKNDLFLLYKTFFKLSTRGFYSLTRREMEVHHEMPMIIYRMTPIWLVTSAIPFGTVVFITLGAKYPKRFLSHHFWSEAQKIEFALMDHKKKLQLYKPILSHLQANLKYVTDADNRNHMSGVLDCLEQKKNPSVEDILLCKPIFEKYPFNIRNLGSSHVKLLLQIHHLHLGWKRKRRLEYFGAFVQAMDRVITREGGVEKLNEDELKWALFFRGLNPFNMEHEDIITWLKNWQLISNDVDYNSLSLLVHCPVLLAFNEPTNLELMKA